MEEGSLTDDNTIRDYMCFVDKLPCVVGEDKTYQNLIKVSRCVRGLAQWIASNKEVRAGQVVRGMMFIMFSVLAVLLSFAGLSMDRTINAKLSMLEKQAGKSAHEKIH